MLLSQLRAYSDAVTATKKQPGTCGILPHASTARTASAAADPARAVLIRLTLALGNLSIEARLRVAFRSSPLLEVEEGIGHLLGYPLWMIRSPLGW